MPLNAPIALTGQDREKRAFTVSVTATNLNRHGAAVQMNRELAMGSTVLIRNKRGKEVAARVAAQISAVEGLYTYGLEFLESHTLSDFWGIFFPPQA